MKRKILLIATLLSLQAVASYAAGPKWAKQANKSLAKVYAIQQAGDTLQANAFFTNETGSLVAPFKTIRQAKTAWVVDASGNHLDIKRILGFNATYDIVLLQAATGKKKTTALPLTSQAVAKGQAVYSMPGISPDTVTQVDKAGENRFYYTLSSASQPSMAGMPLINEAGEVVAIVQTPVVASNTPNYALDILWLQDLSIRALDANSNELRNCQLPLQLPSEESQAASFLYLASSAGNKLRDTYADDFIQNFPGNVAGYIQKAELQTEEHDYEAAFRTYETGLAQVAGQRDELLYARSRTIYNAILQQDKNLPENWTLEQALSDAADAHETTPLPLYTLQQAHIMFVQKRYEDAANSFMEVSKSNLKSAEIFLYAWQCKQNLGAPNEELLALNDSALACFNQPYGISAAPYLLLRSRTLTDMGKLREAINDLNNYEHLMQGQLTAQFYYQKAQLENRVRMWGQAVNDIHTAISMEPSEPVFHAELAALLYRLNDMEGAITACQKAIELDNSLPDAYRLLGIFLREKGDKEGSEKNLKKAIELGDTMAKGILERESNQSAE